MQIVHVHFLNIPMYGCQDDVMPTLHLCVPLKGRPDSHCRESKNCWCSRLIKREHESRVNFCK